MMKALAKAGFTQSYTYFTWRNSKQELTEYFTELTQTEMSEYFRGNLWPNTPDILPFLFKTAGRPAFMIRAVLAATFSSALRNLQRIRAVRERRRCPGREEYLDSEKYQFKERDWNAPGNIKDWITRLTDPEGKSRATNYDNLRFYRADNDAILFYGKMTPARDNIILVVVNLDPFRRQNSFIHVPIEEFGQMETTNIRSTIY